MAIATIKNANPKPGMPGCMIIGKGDYMEIFPIGYGEFKIRKVEG